MQARTGARVTTLAGIFYELENVAPLCDSAVRFAAEFAVSLSPVNLHTLIRIRIAQWHCRADPLRSVAIKTSPGGISVFNATRAIVIFPINSLSLVAIKFTRKLSRTARASAQRVKRARASFPFGN